jgi:hypothetical protein
MRDESCAACLDFFRSLSDPKATVAVSASNRQQMMISYTSQMTKQLFFVQRGLE